MLELQSGRRRSIPPLLMAILCLPNPLDAQEVRVEVATQEPPYYVGEPVVVQFTVEGFDEQPQPHVAIDTATGELAASVRGQLAAANPSVVSQVIQRGGQLYSSKQITYQIQYLVTADDAGEFEVGPFRIHQGKKEAHADALTMSFQTVPIDPDMSVRLILPEHPVYPDQRVQVGVEWRYAGDLDNILKLGIHSPLFDQFRFAPDAPPQRGSSQLPIDTKEGRLALSATTREEQVDGRRFVVVSGTRTLIPDRAGEYALAPITATLRKATTWARSRSPLGRRDDFFGGSLLEEMIGGERRRPATTALLRAVGTEQELIVKPFPITGRPASFAGAVGRGFSMDVAADRTVVHVGDPIGLDIALRGDGNIENASLPPLSADGGMEPTQFRLPDGDQTGALSDGTKRFHISVRVTDESVGEIPALAYSWFDPETESYQTTHSKPIALRVMPAQIISASDVVRNDEDAISKGTDPSESTPSGAIADAAVPNGVGRQGVSTDANSSQPLPRDVAALSLSGADLSVEPNPDVVLRDARRWLGNSAILPAMTYALGFVLIAIALIDRRRRSVDPAILAQRTMLRQQQLRIAQAASLPQCAAANEIAVALRRLVAEAPRIDRDAAQAVIAECESIAYKPDADVDGRLDATLIARAQQIAT